MPSRPDHQARHLAWLSLLALSVLWLARWPWFPVGIDPAYHLLVARQIVEAGGPFTYEWWQGAPHGRAHLYPPLVHLLIAGLLKAGCSPVMALQALSAALVPALVGSIYLVLRRMADPVVALGCLWMAVMPISWMLQVTEAMASGFALIELLWLLAALLERRWLAAMGLLALMCYTHPGLPWVALAGLAVAAAFRAVDARRLMMAALGGIGMAAPWLWHVGRHAASLRVASRMENATLEVLPALWLLAVFGAWGCWKRAGLFRLWPGLWLGSVVAASPFLFRWLCGEGMLLTMVLAGFGLAAAGRLLAGRRPRLGQLGMMAAVAAGVLCSPGAVIDHGRLMWRWPAAAPFHLAGWPHVAPSVEDVQVWSSSMERLSNTVSTVTEPGEILWSNAPYAGGLVAAAASRATASWMLPEVPPQAPAGPRAAQWVLWFKIPMPDEPDLSNLVRESRLRLAAEDELAWLFHNPADLPRARRPEAIISWRLAVVLLWMFLGFIILDFRKDTWPKSKKFSSAPKRRKRASRSPKTSAWRSSTPSALMTSAWSAASSKAA